MDQSKLTAINRCIERINRGEGRAPIEDLYALMAGYVRFAAVRYLGETPEADDVVQEFWLRIEQVAAKCRPYNGYGYLCKTVDNMCRMRLRAASSRNVPLTDEVIEHFESERTPELTLRQQDLKESFAKARERMTPKERQVFALVCYAEASVREIAKQLGLSKSAAARLRKSMTDKLKQTLTEDGWDSRDD